MRRNSNGVEGNDSPLKSKVAKTPEFEGVTKVCKAEEPTEALVSIKSAAFIIPAAIKQHYIWAEMAGKVSIDSINRRITKITFIRELQQK